MTRDKDTYVDLEERVVIAKKSGSKCIVSQHINAGSGNGIECYYSVDNEGKDLADQICEYTAKATGMFNRGSKTKPSNSNSLEDYYAIIRYARTDGYGGKKIVGIIMQNGFLDNDKEYLNTDEKLRCIAKANADAIIHYYSNVSDK